MIIKRFETLVSDFFLYIVKRLERNDEIWYNYIYRGSFNCEIDYEKSKFGSQTKGRQDYT